MLGNPLVSILILLAAACGSQDNSSINGSTELAPETIQTYLEVGTVTKESPSLLGNPWQAVDTANFDLSAPPSHKRSLESLQADELECDFVDYFGTKAERKDLLARYNQLASDAERDEWQALGIDKSLPKEDYSWDPTDPPGGRTPKFYCRFQVGGRALVLKVKYDPVSLYRSNMTQAYPRQAYTETKVQEGDYKANAEVVGEVLSTRLLAGLGFHSDSIYPVKTLKCRGCPVDPWAYTRERVGMLDTNDRFIGFTSAKLAGYKEGLDVKDPSFSHINDLFERRKAWFHLQQNLQNHVVTLHHVVVEAKIDAEKLYKKVGDSDYKGFTLKELIDIPGLTQAERINREALLILMAFINHMDNKAEQQRIVCRDQDFLENKDNPQQSICRKPLLMVQDAGSSFGAGFSIPAGYFTLNKLDRKEWEKLSTWEVPAGWNILNHIFKPDSCVVKIQTFGIGRGTIEGLSRTLQVSPEGLNRLQELAGALQFNQIYQLFDIANISNFPNEDGDAHEWAETFMRKLKRDIIDYEGCQN